MFCGRMERGGCGGLAATNRSRFDVRLLFSIQGALADDQPLAVGARHPQLLAGAVAEGVGAIGLGEAQAGAALVAHLPFWMVYSET